MAFFLKGSTVNSNFGKILQNIPGEMAGRIAAKDWAQTSLGPIENWPQSLKSTVSLVLGTPFPTILYWGPKLESIYNDAYTPLLGAKHETLGKPIEKIWSEAWDVIRTDVEKVLSGQALFYENAPFTLMRHGHPEQTWFDYAYSPLRDESGGISGFLNTAVERTSRIQAEKALIDSKEHLTREQAFLQTLLDNAKVCVAVLQGHELRFTMVNRAYQELRPDVSSPVESTERFPPML